MIGLIVTAEIADIAETVAVVSAHRSPPASVSTTRLRLLCVPLLRRLYDVMLQPGQPVVPPVIVHPAETADIADLPAAAAASRHWLFPRRILRQLLRLHRMRLLPVFRSVLRPVFRLAVRSAFPAALPPAVAPAVSRHS